MTGAPSSAPYHSSDDADHKLPVFTIGHSTRSIPEFVGLLRAGNVQIVVDVRRVPRSKTNPQYNFDILADELAPYQIRYLRIEELGGLRKKSAVAEDVNGFWDNRSFHNYADYALSAEFRAGLDALLDLSATQRTAIMCAEAVWWRCHRRIIADYLMNSGRAVFHLMNIDDIRSAEMTRGVVPVEDGLHYPAPDVHAT